MLEELPEYKNRVQHLDDPVPQYPIRLAKRMLKHTLLGLKFLHANGVVHGDVQPGNILFEARNLDAVAESDLKQNSAKITESLSRLDGKKDIWAPKHLANKQSLVDYVDVGPDVVVKISDLGAGTFEHTTIIMQCNTEMKNHSLLVSPTPKEDRYTPRLEGSRAHTKTTVQLADRYLELWVSFI